MKFIIGIGNPGREYQNTRHNVGFLVLESLQARQASKKAHWKKVPKLGSEVCEIGDKVLLIKPATYVNQTGQVITALISGHRAKSSEILVVCDDVNLAFGKLRLRATGSDGGHHGLLSVVEALGSKDFPRLRVGIKNESMPKDLTNFVLGHFNGEEAKKIPVVLEKAVMICQRWLEDDFENALSALSRIQSVQEIGLLQETIKGNK